VFGWCIRVSLSQHGVVHLLWRRVFPVALAVAAGDGGGFAGQREIDVLFVVVALVGEGFGHVVEWV
jgi:hypothetical protein